MECANDQCHLKADDGDPDINKYRLENMQLSPCLKCHAASYCSKRCQDQHWTSAHQFECTKEPKVHKREIEEIEGRTPFIKQGSIRLNNLDKEFKNMQLSDLKFITDHKILGKGSYGQVELAEHLPTGRKLAVKKIDKSSLANKKIKKTLMREVEIHRKLMHDNIIRLFASLEDENYIYLVLEYANKGNLFHLIRSKNCLNEDEAFYFFIQACGGIYFLHKNGFIHRDIKPENLLIGDENMLKICDFGWCVDMEQNEGRKTFCGTLEYMAPEMLQN
jgi:serine/threonine protein kinase